MMQPQYQMAYGAHMVRAPMDKLCWSLSGALFPSGQ